MRADSFIRKADHKDDGEDYVLHFNDINGWSGVIGSDGCSSVEKASEGSMVLVREVYSFLKKLFEDGWDTLTQRDLEVAIGYSIFKTKESLERWDIEPLSGLATLYGVISNGKTASVFLIGDGCVFLNPSSNEPKSSYLVDYNNQPWYPNYQSNQEFINAYKSVRGKFGTQPDVVYRRKEGFEIEEITGDPNKSGDMFSFFGVFLTNYFDLIGVSSDGISEVWDEDGNKKWDELSYDLSSTKTNNGCFFKRRCKAALRKTVLKDDFSAGAITFKEDFIGEF